jgi:hypothetical protein
MSNATSVASSEPVEDFLSEDTEIPSQKVVLLSFLSPEKVLASKDVYQFQQFIKDYELQWRTTKLEAWLAEQVATVNRKLEEIAGGLEKTDLSGASMTTLRDAATSVRSQELRVERVVEDFKEYVRRAMKDAAPGDIQQEYEDFLFKNSARLEEEFFAKNNFRTTIRGIKVRGVFSSEAEASVRAKRLQKSDPTFNIYAGQVGKWMAWEPDPNKVVDQEYANDQLNTLMKKYRENEESRDQFYNEQKRKRMGTGAAEPTSTEVKLTEMESEGASNAAAGPGSAAATNAGSYDGLFSGPADLAIQRKMDAAKKE